MNDLRLDRNSESNSETLDLKVCEGCGALWLRAGVAGGVYCRRCVIRLNELPMPRGRHAGGRKPSASSRRGQGCAAVGGGR